ncbi:MAG: DUF4136 domain-containing protein [Burkholderiaceae bacterium]
MVGINRRLTLSVLGATALLALSGCASFNTVSADAQSFGSWPAMRQPGSYAFERLPSQQQTEESRKLNSQLEDRARVALEKAGFTAAADPKSADVMVSLGVRTSRQDRAPWDDPQWWRGSGSYFSWRYGPAWRPYYGRFGYTYPIDPLTERRYDREVGLILRDGKTGEPLYEARASNDGFTGADPELAGALFEIAMSDFPQTRPEPHRVSIPLSPKTGK